MVDQATRVLSGDDEILHFGKEARNGYERRYLCHPYGDGESCLSVGIRDPFEGFQTPFWLRFHSGTTGFPEIVRRLKAHTPTLQSRDEHGHFWLPLEIEGGLVGVSGLVELIRVIQSIAYPAGAP